MLWLVVGTSYCLRTSYNSVTAGRVLVSRRKMNYTAGAVNKRRDEKVVVNVIAGALGVQAVSLKQLRAGNSVAQSYTFPVSSLSRVNRVWRRVTATLLFASSHRLQGCAIMQAIEHTLIRCRIVGMVLPLVRSSSVKSSVCAA